jgi:hypothetical protein
MLKAGQSITSPINIVCQLTVVTDSETKPNDHSQEGGQPGTRKRYAGPQYIGSGERGAVGRDALAAQEDVGPGLAIRVGSCCDGGLREDTGYLGRWAVFAGFVSRGKGGELHLEDLKKIRKC